MRVVLARLGTRRGGLWVVAALSALAFGGLVGGNVLLHPGRGIVGSNPSGDFQIMTWSLRWWPWAIAHGHDPLRASILWAPGGFPTLWMTTIPAPALVALPVTLLGSPLLAYNLLMAAAVVLAAVSAYLLCFELTARAWPSVLGGLLFGLSPYMLGHLLSQHLTLVVVFPLPLLGLLAVRRLRGRTSAPRFVAGSAVLLLVLAGSSLELFADLAFLAVVVGAIALAAAGHRRRELARLAGLLALAYAATLPLLGTVAAVALSQQHGAVRGLPADYAVDLLEVVVPTPTLWLGAAHWAQSISGDFVGNIGERDGYVGLPLLAVALLALRAYRTRGAWLLGLVGAVALVLSFGPVPALRGRPLGASPLSTAGLPVLGNALPARFSVFVALALACLAALWLARPGRRALRLGVAALLVVSLAPNFVPSPRLAHAWGESSSFAWSTPSAPAGFVDDPAWRQVVPAGANVLVLPTRDRTAASYWQLRSGFRFALAVPETPFTPPPLAGDPTVVRLVDDVLVPLDGPALGAARLRAFARARDVRAIVVTPREESTWRHVVAAATAAQPVRLAGSLVYPVAPGLPPLRAVGESHTVTDGAATLDAWLAFDGTRGRVRARLAGGPVATLSAPAADAEAPAAALDRSGRAAVAFTEWRGGRSLLRVAVLEGSGWTTTTLDETALPIWSPHVAVTSTGTVVAAWVDVLAAGRALRAAALEPGGAWRTTTLAVGDGLGAIALRAGADVVAAAWHASRANEQRIDATVYAAGAWQYTTTLARSLDVLDALSLTRGGGSVRWRSWRPGGAAFYTARRRGLRWGAPALRAN